MKTPIKRLFFDIEVSPNIALCWSAGYKIQIPYENIIQERAIICVCYKWEGSKKIESFVWNKGDDKQLLKDFIKVVSEADEVVGHNSDRFDLKWLRTRCAFHGIYMPPTLVGVDTLKISKGQFRFNSNRLDYLGEFLGVGGKKAIPGSYNKLWKAVTLDNDQKALSEMVSYCKRDVQLLEDVYNKLEKFAPHKTHVAVLNGGDKSDCPYCGSNDTRRQLRPQVSAAGALKQRRQCRACNRWYTCAITKKEEKK